MESKSSRKSESLLAQAFSAALDQDPTKRARLAQQMRIGNIVAIQQGLVDDRIVFMHADLIEQVTGIDVGKLIFDDVKKELFPEDDPLSDVRSTGELLAAIEIYFERYGKINVLKHALLVSTETINKWKKGRRATREALKLVLSGLLQLRNGKIPNAPSAPQLEPAATDSPPVSSGPSTDQREIIGAGITALRSIVTVMESTLLDPSKFLDGDRANIIDIVRRLGKNVGITNEVFERLSITTPLTEDDERLLGIRRMIQGPTSAQRRKR